jgi:hypothetical protein
MIAVLPNSRYIGPLELVEVYEYFDGPKLFACRSLGGQLFLGLWVGASRKGESYWLVALTPERYKMVRSGGLTLARALSQPESGFIYLCTVAFADGCSLEWNCPERRSLSSWGTGRIAAGSYPQPSRRRSKLLSTPPTRLKSERPYHRGDVFRRGAS